MSPTIVDVLRSQLEMEIVRSRRALEQVPANQQAWKPHDRSMSFGYLAHMVATIPSWVAMILQKDELDVAPVSGSTRVTPPATSAEYLVALETAADEARVALGAATDEHLATSWRLLAAGQVVVRSSRREMIQDTLSHWSHHRGQMTVYLRLMGAQVPALFGPSADDTRF